jgi:hypothetical protein
MSLHPCCGATIHSKKCKLPYEYPQSLFLHSVQNQPPTDSAVAGLVLLVVLRRQWVALVGRNLVLAIFTAIDSRMGSRSAGLMQRVKCCVIVLS